MFKIPGRSQPAAASRTCRALLASRLLEQLGSPGWHETPYPQDLLLPPMMLCIEGLLEGRGQMHCIPPFVEFKPMILRCKKIRDLNSADRSLSAAKLDKHLQTGICAWLFMYLEVWSQRSTPADVQACASAACCGQLRRYQVCSLASSWASGTLFWPVYLQDPLPCCTCSISE